MVGVAREVDAAGGTPLETTITATTATAAHGARRTRDATAPAVVGVDTKIGAGDATAVGARGVGDAGRQLAVKRRGGARGRLRYRRRLDAPSRL